MLWIDKMVLKQIKEIAYSILVVKLEYVSDIILSIIIMPQT